jgi:uncharacterized protein
MGPAARAVVERLRLAPHPEGGWYRETWRDGAAAARGHASLILFLLAEGESSHWHRVDAAELWLFHAGAPLTLSIAEGSQRRTTRLSTETPQAIVPANAWQAAVSEGEWTLVGCVVAPAFEFGGFELAPEGWEP